MYYWNKETTDSFVSNVVALCRELQIDTVAGPVLSGAVMSAAIAASASANNYTLKALMLNKHNGSYEPAHHGGGVRWLYNNSFGVERVMVVDDIIATGDSIIHSVRDIGKYRDSQIVAVVCGGHFRYPPRLAIRSLFPSIRLYYFSDDHLVDVTDEQGEEDDSLDP